MSRIFIRIEHALSADARRQDVEMKLSSGIIQKLEDVEGDKMIMVAEPVTAATAK